jgi:hypothetical protein
MGDPAMLAGVQHPRARLTMHILDQLSEHGYYRSPPAVGSNPAPLATSTAPGLPAPTNEQDAAPAADAALATAIPVATETPAVDSNSGNVLPRPSEDPAPAVASSSVPLSPATTVPGDLPPPMAGRLRLHVSVGVLQLSVSGVLPDHFDANMRIIAFWEEPDLEVLGLGSLAAQARASADGYIALSPTELALFEDKWGTSLRNFFNVYNASSAEIDEYHVRVYGGVPGRTGILWMRTYRVACRQNFHLHDFPCDIQELQVELRMTDARTRDRFDMLLTGITFHRGTLVPQEWELLPPTVARGEASSASSCALVRFHARRQPRFYITNVMAIMCSFNLLSLLAFAMPIEDVSSRVSTLLTLILTAVAFKFFLVGILPRISYHTLLDYYVLLSTGLLFVTSFTSIVPNYVPDILTSSVVTPRKVNSALFAITLIASVALAAGWGWTAFHRKSTLDVLRTPLVPVPGKTWLAFRYYPRAHFLHPEESQ